MEKALHVPLFFQKWIITILEKMCITDWAGGDGEFSVEVALGDHSGCQQCPTLGSAARVRGPLPPPPASELVALYPNLWLLVDQGDLDPVDLVVGASSGSP